MTHLNLKYDEPRTIWIHRFTENCVLPEHSNYKGFVFGLHLLVSLCTTGGGCSFFPSRDISALQRGLQRLVLPSFLQQDLSAWQLVVYWWPSVVYRWWLSLSLCLMAMVIVLGWLDGLRFGIFFTLTINIHLLKNSWLNIGYTCVKTKFETIQYLWVWTDSLLLPRLFCVQKVIKV